MKVTMIAATTLCGRISPAPLGSRQDRLLLEEMRDATGASLMGGGTLRQADPVMAGTTGVDPRRIRAFVTLSGDIPPVDERRVFGQGPAPLVFTSAAGRPALEERTRGRAEVIALPPGPTGLSLAAALTVLADRGVKSLLVEGGARLNYAALAEKVVDEILLTITPQISGDSGAAGLADGPRPLAAPFLMLEPLSCELQSSGEIFTRYRILYEDNHA